MSTRSNTPVDTPVSAEARSRQLRLPKLPSGSRRPVVLDATLRDGGYLNDWGFQPEHADQAVRLAAEGGADVIEVGYLDDSPGLPETAGCPPNVLARLRGAAGSAGLAAMMRPDVRDMTSVLDLRRSHLDLVRIPTQISDPEPARRAALACRERGVAVSANLTNITAYSEAAITAAVARLSDVVDLFYLADSRGALLPDQVAGKVAAVREAWGGPLGFHAHDNLGWALANTRAARDAGCTWLDGTVCALGMGGRNLRLSDALVIGRRGPAVADAPPGLEALRRTRESDLGMPGPGAEMVLYRMSAERNLPMAWPGELIARFGLEEARRKLQHVPSRNWFELTELEPWLAPDAAVRRVIRQRVYESQGADHAEADHVFYERVKPVHERHGAVFLGRHRDNSGRVVVRWLYASEEDLVRIQGTVAEDPDTLRTRVLRRSSGLHGRPFEELVLRSTDPDA